MKYAIVNYGGKQLKIQEGDTFELERQKGLEMDVLAFSDENELLIGSPVLKNVTVQASFLGEKKGKKVVVARYKSKSRYRKTKGHRQPLSIVHIDAISLAGAKPATKSATKSKTTPDSKTRSTAKNPAKSATRAKVKKEAK